MKKIILAIIIVLPLSQVAMAEQKYNAYESRWETVPDNSNWQTRYNPYSNDWSYQPRDANVEYNAYENSWDWDSGHGNYDTENDKGGFYEW